MVCLHHVVSRFGVNLDDHRVTRVPPAVVTGCFVCAVVGGRRTGGGVDDDDRRHRNQRSER